MKLYEILNEGFRGDWAILPATMALYNKRTVDLKTAASTWDGATTILICTKREGSKERICFVSSSGDGFDHYKKDIGKTFAAYHDQTGGSKGDYKVVNVVVMKDGEILHKANDTGIHAKASLSVFK